VLRARRQAGVPPYARKIDLLTRHWSGQHRRVVQGINRLTLLWTDGGALIPCDDRLDEKAVDQLSKNDPFRAMLASARERGFAPACLVFDSRYASLANRKAIRGHGWRWLTQLAANRPVNPDGTGNRPLGAWPIAEAGTRVHLQGYGLVRVSRIVAPDGGTEHGAARDGESNGRRCARQ
jgi:hypothetical protein